MLFSTGNNYMKFGFRIPSLTKRIAARTSVKRIIRHNLGFKAPRGLGWITDPKKALYNRVYNKTSRGCLLSMLFLLSIPGALVYVAWTYFIAWNSPTLLSQLSQWFAFRSPLAAITEILKQAVKRFMWSQALIIKGNSGRDIIEVLWVQRKMPLKVRVVLGIITKPEGNTGGRNPRCFYLQYVGCIAWTLLSQSLECPPKIPSQNGRGL